MNLLSLEIPQTGYTSYPFASPLFQNGFCIEFAPITVIVGENGVGKSTLLESLAYKIGFPTYGGNINSYIFVNELNRVVAHNNTIGNPTTTLAEELNEHAERNAQVDSNELAPYMKLKWRYRNRKGMFMRAETFAMIINMPRYDVGNVSHGEGIVDIIGNIHDDGVYVLDEPESGLSPTKIMELMVLMDNKQRTEGCQFILSTHNPMLMCVPQCLLLEMTRDCLRPTTPEATSHYELTKYFLNNKDKMLHNMFD